MTSPFATGLRSTDRHLQRGVEALEGQLNRAAFLERSITVRLPGGDAVMDSWESWRRSSTTTFESWYPAAMGNASAVNVSAVKAIDILWAWPFLYGRKQRIDRLAFEVITVSGVGGKARIGIYDSTDDENGTPYPNRLIVDGGDTDVRTANGVKTSTVDVVLEPGRIYWMVYWSGVSACTTRGMQLAGMYPMLGMPAAIGTAWQVGYQVASTYSAAANGLPQNYPAGATADTAAGTAVFVRYAEVEQPRVVTIPVWAPPTSGFALQRARVLSAASLDPKATPYALVKPQVLTSAGALTLGTLDTRASALTVGGIDKTSGVADLHRSLQTTDVLAVEVTQTGYPRVDLSACSVQFDVRYNGG